MPPSLFCPDTTWTGTQILLSEQHCAQWRGLPHARGGVSGSGGQCGACSTVFPTPVGVFPYTATGYGTKIRLPHARGGVSGC